MAFDKKLLSRLTILYVEDDDTIRNELSQLLSNFFKTVYSAVDGKDGIEVFKKNKNDINIILSDINMPQMNGLDMVSEIREIDNKIPVFFSTAHSDNEFLAQAIKLHVHEYIVKPIDIRYLLGLFNDLASILYQEFLIIQQTAELEKYKEILDTNNILIKTDIDMKITYVNDLFCKSCGFSKDELLGKEFKSLRHKDTSIDIYNDIYSKVLNAKSWHGKLKNITKENGSISVENYTIPTLSESGEMTGTISIQRDITDALNKKRELQLALMRDKSDIFIRSKEGSVEQNIQIRELKQELLAYEKSIATNKKEMDKFIYAVEKYSVENRRLKSELATYKKNANYVEERHGTSLKLTRENTDLRLENKKITATLENLQKDRNKEVKQLKVNYEIEIDDLEELIKQLRKKIDTMDSNEVLEEKLNYWKEKASVESQRVETLEKQIIAHGDKVFMNKIFD